MTNSAKIDFIYLSEQDMIRAGVDDMPGCVDAMDEMFKLLHIGDYRMPGACLLYTSPSPRDRQKSRMPSSA